MAGSGLGSELSLRLGLGEGDLCDKNESEKNKKTMTIFYNGEMCVCDLTEFQARAIISTAMREIKTKNEEKQQQQQQQKQKQYAGSDCTDGTLYEAIVATISPKEEDESG